MSTHANTIKSSVKGILIACLIAAIAFTAYALTPNARKPVIEPDQTMIGVANSSYTSDTTGKLSMTFVNCTKGKDQGQLISMYVSRDLARTMQFGKPYLLVYHLEVYAEQSTPMVLTAATPAPASNDCP